MISRNYHVALIIWLAWPITSMREAWVMHRLSRGGFRFILGVVFLAVGMFFWGRLALVIADKVIGVFWINIIVAFVALALTSPILTSFTLPKHG